VALIGAVTLSIVKDIANADITVKYTLTGSSFDVASGQPYTEIVDLIGDDTGMNPPEDGIDDAISSGVLAITNVVFPNTTAINRTRLKTIPLANLKEDVSGVSEIRARVRLNPMVAQAASKESNQFNL
jgi:hypothetical protein